MRKNPAATTLLHEEFTGAPNPNATGLGRVLTVTRLDADAVRMVVQAANGPTRLVTLSDVTIPYSVWCQRCAGKVK